MRVWTWCIGMVVCGAVMGCVETSPESEPEVDEEDVAAAPSPQLDPGYRSYTIKQSGVIVASAWAGQIASGETVEYWVSKPAYAPSSARTIEGATQSCATWKRSVCGASWSGSTRLKAIFSQQTLNCALPPGPCSPPSGALSFLGAGSYSTVNVDNTAFAWTYSDGTCEYWAMNHLISGASTQSPFTPGYTSHSNFISQVCAMGSPPSDYFEATYTDIGSCSAIQC